MFLKLTEDSNQRFVQQSFSNLSLDRIGEQNDIDIDNDQ